MLFLGRTVKRPQLASTGQGQPPDLNPTEHQLYLLKPRRKAFFTTGKAGCSVGLAEHQGTKLSFFYTSRTCLNQGIIKVNKT